MKLKFNETTCCWCNKTYIPNADSYKNYEIPKCPWCGKCNYIRRIEINKMQMQIKCLCGHVNNYKKYGDNYHYICTDDLSIKQFYPYNGKRRNGSMLIICPICDTVRITKEYIC
jgi:hypothetical protein